MQTCPICKSEYEGMVCICCGYDRSRDCENHPTLGAVPPLASVSRRAALWKNTQGELLHCPGCGGSAFLFRTADGNLVCTDCGQTTKTPGLTAAPATAAVPAQEQPAKEIKERVGDIIKFGRYPQNGDSPDDIEWIILDQCDTLVLVISNCILALGPYGSHKKSDTWKTSQVRQWLNDTFLRNAFTAEEEAKIVPAKVDCGDQHVLAALSGSVLDRIFLLSRKEVEANFRSDAARKAITTYTVCDAWWYYQFGERQNYPHGRIIPWWTRSTSVKPSRTGSVYSAAVVNEKGTFGMCGSSDRAVGIRPAMWINLGT